MCCTEDYSCKLLNYFNEVVYVESSPYVINKKEIYKENGEIVIKNTTKEIDLKELTLNKKTTDLISPECFDYGVLQQIKKSKNIKEFFFYPKNLIQLFRSKSNLYTYLNNLGEDYYLLTNSKIYKKIKNKTNIEIKQIECFDEFTNDVLDKTIIIFRKDSKVYLNKEVNSHPEFEELVFVKCGVDLDDFIIINLI